MENTVLQQGYSTKQAAELLNRSTATIWRYIKTGKIKATKLGGCWIIPADELQKILA